MLRGPVYIENEYYNLGEDGVLSEGWITWNGNTYYNLSGGLVATGWQDIDGKQYYFDWEGIMLTDTEVDGITLGADGASVSE